MTNGVVLRSAFAAAAIPAGWVALGVTTLVFLAGAGVGAAVVGGLGEVLGSSGALIALVVLPVAGTLVMLRQLRAAAPVDVEVPAAS
ncbi:MAG: hypothetical protein ACRDRP_21855 [Pseudonocardiaceae bacterium]